MEEDRDSLRWEIKLLAGRVRDLEQGRDIDEMRILHAYNHLEETHSLVSEIGATTLEVMISCL